MARLIKPSATADTNISIAQRNLRTIAEYYTNATVFDKAGFLKDIAHIIERLQKAEAGVV